eukprot:CAMPEP_0175345578 /NCGR_PEP_ID=MMETSP0095-20121207/8437_1 /TAXON_ID=311494 /ORGANISM="Alexandrium monilatum, Strain CCMP3105" /LENGTH=79 /DNA_ID=CAMNT_0016643045 /DNA_START=19 /DNA_END=258 /DNA_ORIENTATION=+
MANVALSAWLKQADKYRKNGKTYTMEGHPPPIQGCSLSPHPQAQSAADSHFFMARNGPAASGVMPRSLSFFASEGMTSW